MFNDESQILHGKNAFVINHDTQKCSCPTIYDLLRLLPVKMVAPVGLEPTTNSLKANCSTNWATRPLKFVKELLLTTYSSYHIFFQCQLSISFFRRWPPLVKGQGSSAIQRCSRGVLLPPRWKNEYLLLLYLTANFQRINFFLREVWTYKYIQIYEYIQKDGVPTRNRT